MVKYLIVFLSFVFCFCTDAFAIVAQSASKALSYNNISGSSGSSFTTMSTKWDKTRNDTKNTTTITIGTGNSYTKSVSINNSLLIPLPKEDYESEGEIIWKFEYNSKYMVMTSNIVKGNKRNITFSFVKKGTSTITIRKLDVGDAEKRKITVKVTIQ